MITSATPATEECSASATPTIATEREQGHIEALSARYTKEPRTDRSELDQAHADAMRELADAYPDDLDAATLFAESLMNLVLWDYWDENGQPRAGTAERYAAQWNRPLGAAPTSTLTMTAGISERLD
ncbi:hypothetical protein [Aquisalimonas sp.]|uniref:hypothetical protein n=1 Tax=Aquisalimonas sp. TaxID=1872621 RepID=UPI0025B85B29|nr:hypothetical protein [Aquisalimonas sp.]